jgi:hypothetical protein
MRQFVAKDREEKTSSGNKSQDPGNCRRQRRQPYVAKLDNMALQVTRNQPNTERNYSKPAVVYAYRNSIDTSNYYLAFEDLNKTHHYLERSVKKSETLAQQENRRGAKDAKMS